MSGNRGSYVRHDLGWQGTCSPGENGTTAGGSKEEAGPHRRERREGERGQMTGEWKQCHARRWMGGVAGDWCRGGVGSRRIRLKDGSFLWALATLSGADIVRLGETTNAMATNPALFLWRVLI